MNLTAHRATKELSNATGVCVKPGIGSQEAQEGRCLPHVQLSISVARMRRGGSLVVIQQWLKGPSQEKCVFTGQTVAVNGRSTSVFVTAAPSTYTNCLQHLTAIYAIVATGEQVGYTSNITRKQIISRCLCKFEHVPPSKYPFFLMNCLLTDLTRKTIFHA